MAQASKLENEVEIKSCAERFYKLVKGQTYLIPNASPDKVQAVEVLEGDWGTNGSVMLWKLSIGGVVEIMKEKVEIDEANKKLTHVALEGKSFDYYKTFKTIKKVTPKPERGVVALTLVYEKRRNDSPEPHKYIECFTDVVKDIDAYLLKE